MWRCDARERKYLRELVLSTVGRARVCARCVRLQMNEFRFSPLTEYVNFSMLEFQKNKLHKRRNCLAGHLSPLSPHFTNVTTTIWRTKRKWTQFISKCVMWFDDIWTYLTLFGILFFIHLFGFRLPVPSASVNNDEFCSSLPQPSVAINQSITIHTHINIYTNK